MVKRADLISEQYLHQNKVLHRGRAGFGTSGWKHADSIVAFANELEFVRTILDYGAGECTLFRKLKTRQEKFKIHMYDPAIPALAAMPAPADLVVCTDVLEHVEPEKVARVVAHLHDLTLLGCYLAISTRPANKLLPNGQNAHAVIESAAWWTKTIEAEAWTTCRAVDLSGKEIRFWLTK